MEARRAAGGIKPDSVQIRMLFDLGHPQMRSQAQIIEQNLRAIGFDAKFEPVERSVQIDRGFIKRDFDMTLASLYSADYPAIGYSRVHVTSNGPAANSCASSSSNPVVAVYPGIDARDEWAGVNRK